MKKLTISYGGRTFAVPQLTSLEVAAYNDGRVSGYIRLGLSERVYSAAWNRADDKVSELLCLLRRGGDQGEITNAIKAELSRVNL